MPSDPPVANTNPTAPPSGRRMLRIAAVLCAAPTVLAWFASWHWACDLMTHFPAQSAVVMALLAGALALARDRRAASAAFVVAAINGAALFPFWWPAPSAEIDGPVRKLISANVHTGNRDAAALLELVKREDPDFVLLLEVDNRWLRALELLRASHPHYLERGRPDNFGIAFYSKHRPESLETIELADSEVPNVVGRLTLDGRPLTLCGVHPLPPIGGEYSALRNRHLDALAAWIAAERAGEAPADSAPAEGEVGSDEAERGAFLVAGDLNVTSWSPVFSRFVRKSGLIDSRRGRGIQPTWPTTSPLIRIPIDHVLTSPEIAVKRRRVGPHIGSDHFPVVVEFGRSRPKR